MTTTAPPGALSPGSAPSARPPGAAPRAGRRGWLLLLAVALVLAVRTWAVEPVRVPTGSMRPTLLPGDHVLVEKVSRYARSWQRGDLVVFAGPDGVLAVKRVAGLPGDRVALRDGLLHVNGTPVNERYAPADRIDGVYAGPTEVPAGSVFLLGDNRRNSRDSRSYGPVPVEDLEGRVVLRVWPLDRWGAPG